MQNLERNILKQKLQILDKGNILDGYSIQKRYTNCYMADIIILLFLSFVRKPHSFLVLPVLRMHWLLLI